MGDLSSIIAIGDSLPSDEQERFLQLIENIQQSDHEDEDLQVLEAIGLVALSMNKVPAEVSKIVARAQALTDDQANSLGEQFSAVLTESLDTPSYKDLRETIRGIQDQETRFQQKLRDLHKRLSESEKIEQKRSRMLPSIAIGFTAGIVGAALVAIASYFIVKPAPESPIPAELRPYMTLHEHGHLLYFETELLEEGENVAIYTIGGENIEAAFMDGGNAVVVRRLQPDRTQVSPEG